MNWAKVREDPRGSHASTSPPAFGYARVLKPILQLPGGHDHGLDEREFTGTVRFGRLQVDRDKFVQDRHRGLQTERTVQDTSIE